ncbi:MAG: oligosaccharide flippase family protein [Candidatus Magnetoovum sp. WYHC-5]|nr:oligosaccharide flippase family protein [Candidatus Magnetoovum sp. WYHC-5]
MLSRDSKKHSIAKSIVVYSTSNLYVQVMSLLNSFIRPRLLGPEMFGLWNLLNVFITYGSYTHLGTRSPIRYLLPYYESQNKRKEVETLKGTIYYSTFCMNLIFIVFIIAYSFKPGLDLTTRFGFLITSLIVLITWYNEHYINLLRGYQNFILISKANLIRTTASFVFSIIFIYLFGIYGALFSVVLALITSTLYLKLQQVIEKHHSFNMAVFIENVKMGFFIFVFNIITVLLLTCDKLIISYLLDNKQLGLYGLAVAILTPILNIPSISREVIEPKLMEQIANSSTERNIDEFFIKPLMTSAYLMPFLIGPAFLVLPFFINIFFPKYIQSIAPAQILLIGSYFLALSYTFRGIIIANKWQNQAIPVMSIPLLVNISLSIVFIKTGFGINGVAFGCSVAFLLLTLFSFIYISRKSKYFLTAISPKVIYLLIPFTVMCLNIYSLNYMNYIFKNSEFLNEYIIIFIKLCLFITITLMTILYAHKKQQLNLNLNLNKYLKKFKR